MSDFYLEMDLELQNDMIAFYSENLALPPLASRIYVFLMFDFEKKGYTFDEIIGEMSASKSSVSEALKLLLEKTLIISKLPTEQRKRYFMINSDYGRTRFDAILSKLKAEISIIRRVEKLPEVPQKSIDKMLEFRQMLERNAENIENSLKKIKS